jgi:purine-binding chemotaxis protein CheW
MSNTAISISERARDLRRDFDRAFAEPIRGEPPQEDLLAISVGGQPYALRLQEIAGIFVDKKITSVPGSTAAQRGIAGFRGAILPVYDLQVLLGQSIAETARWLVIAAGAPVALAFEVFERQLRVAPDDILPKSAGSETAAFAREFVRTRAHVRPVLHLPSVIAAIKALKAEAILREE